MKRYKYNLSHYRLLTADMGLLIPIGLQEVIPGDLFNHSTSILLRFSPMVSPVMHPIDVRIHHFYVPNRVVADRMNMIYMEEHGVPWHDWEAFVTGGKDNDYAEPIPTYMLDTILAADPLTGGRIEGTILDYMGLVKNGDANYAVNTYPLHGYKMLWDEFYRDQDLQDESLNDKRVFPDFICWEKDYLTTSRPWPYKGPKIMVPTYASTDGAPVVDQQIGYFTLEDLRRNSAIQRFAEARAKYGSRYSEYLRYLGVNPNDSRLDRPEYLGGGRARVNISEVLQTAPETGASAETDTEYGVGDLYGHGIGALKTRPYRKQFTEHGYVHTVMSVRPHAIYSNGIDRHWLKRNADDYFIKEFSYIGDQPLYKGEVYADTNTNHDVWAYQSRYDEYRSQHSSIHGDFRGVMDYWHLARKFDEAPALNKTFVACKPSKRIFSEQTHHCMWVMVQHTLGARRPVPSRELARTI